MTEPNPHTIQNSPPVVLHVRVMAGTGGGPEKTILRSPKYVDPSRYRLIAVYIHPEGDPGIEKIVRQYRQAGFELLTIPERGPLDFRTLRRLGQLCRRLNVAIWHGHDYKSNLFGVLLRRYHPMKLINTVHQWGESDWRLDLYRKFDQWSIRRYDQTVTVSWSLEEACRSFGVRPEKLCTVFNAIELSDWTRKQTRQQAKTQLGLDPGMLHIGAVGRLSKAKALHRLLQLAANLRQTPDVPPFEVLLLGDGPCRGDMEALAKELDLEKSVRFLGWQTEPKVWYETFDLLAMTSYREGLSNTLLEALAMEVPALTTAVSGSAEVTDHGRCGLILPGEDPADWTAPVAELLTNPARRTELAHAGRARIEEHFDFAKRMERMIELYDSLLNHGDRA